MSHEHADFINGLHVVAYELQRVIGELDEMQDRLGISGLDRVSLDPLQWALNKLADDLHDANVELRSARLEVVSAQAGQLQSLSVFNGLRHELDTVKAERDAARQLHLVECRKYNAEVERRLALEKQVAELTAERDAAREQHLVECRRNNAGMERRLALETQVAGLSSKVRELEKQLAEMKGREELQNVFSAGQAGKILGLEGVVESLTAERDRLQQQVEKIDRAAVSCATAGEVLKKLDELPPAAAAETPPWSHWGIGTRLVKGPGGTEIVERGIRSLADGSSRQEFRIVGNPRWFELSHLHSIGWREETEADKSPEPSGEGPVATGPDTDPYQWQVGDVVESEGESPRLVITRDAKGWVFFNQIAFGLPQFEWEKLGWGLYSKASDMPEMLPFTPQQVEAFAAVTEPIDDSVGTDGEGQS
jgi:hypothetical protein